MKWFPLDVFSFGQIILIDEEEKEIIFLIIQVLLLCECIDDFFFLNLHKKLLYDHYNKTNHSLKLIQV